MRRSGRLFLPSRSGEQNIVQYQTISRRIGKQVEISGGITHEVSVVLRIVSAIVGPLSLAKLTMDILDHPDGLRFAHHGHITLQKLGPKRCGLAHKSVNNLRVILRQDGGNDIPLGREIKERKEILELSYSAMIIRAIDI